MNETVRKNKFDGILASKLSAKDRRLVRNRVVVSLSYKGYRRLVRINPNDDKKRQRFLLEREYQNMVRDINNEHIISEYKLNEE